MTTVLAFGAFDPLHAGHAHLLAHAAAYGDKLVVALAIDDAIRELKHHEPRQTFDERKAALMLLPPVDDVVMSVPNDGFAVIDAVQPDVIATGYDQQHLRDALTDWMATHRIIPVVNVDAHEPEKYKSSLIK